MDVNMATRMFRREQKIASDPARDDLPTEFSLPDGMPHLTLKRVAPGEPTASGPYNCCRSSLVQCPGVCAPLLRRTD